MRTIAVIQARWSSTRLPGKVLKEIEGKTMLGRVISRVQRARKINGLVVATTVNSNDYAVVKECERLGAATFRGSEKDVLDRFYQAVQTYHPDFVVRITADCPLIDPELVDHVIQEFLKKRLDYASNTLVRTFPRGLDTEVMTVEALVRAWKEAKLPYQRSHVTPYLYENPHSFRLQSIYTGKNYSRYRWTVDTQADLDFVRAVYKRLMPKENFGWREALQVVTKDPALAALNSETRQKTLKEG